MFVVKMLELELLQGRSRAFVPLLPSRGSHPKMRRRNLNGEAGHTPFDVQLRTSSPKGSSICSPASAKQPLIQRKNHSPTRIGGHHRSVPGTLKIRSLTYIGTTKRAPSVNLKLLSDLPVAHRFA